MNAYVQVVTLNQTGSVKISCKSAADVQTMPSIIAGQIANLHNHANLQHTGTHTLGHTH